MEDVPCPLERTAASALLLLSSSNNATPLSSNISSFSFDELLSKDSSPSDSRSCTSSLTSEGSSEEIRGRQLRVLAFAARCHEAKLKVVRRTRSKNHRNSDRRKSISISWRKPVKISPAPMPEYTETSSLSTGSSAVTRAPKLHGTKAASKNSLNHEQGEKVGSAYMRRRAEAIMKFLSLGCASEVKIRQVLGDSPDTSKALRILLKLEDVKRSGAGGRLDPYLYTIAGGPLSNIESS